MKFRLRAKCKLNFTFVIAKTSLPEAQYTFCVMLSEERGNEFAVETSQMRFFDSAGATLRMTLNVRLFGFSFDSADATLRMTKQSTHLKQDFIC